MKAQLLYRERLIIAENRFVEMVVWQLSSSVMGSHHCFKYRLAFVVNGRCVLRYDNEAGKGDHRHHCGKQQPYRFTTPQALLTDFWHDVDTWEG
jgi:hypothetical protein